MLRRDEPPGIVPRLHIEEPGQLALPEPADGRRGSTYAPTLASDNRGFERGDHLQGTSPSRGGGYLIVLKRILPLGMSPPFSHGKQWAKNAYAMRNRGLSSSRTHGPRSRTRPLPTTGSVGTTLASWKLMTRIASLLCRTNSFVGARLRTEPLAQFPAPAVSRSYCHMLGRIRRPLIGSDGWNDRRPWRGNRG